MNAGMSNATLTADTASNMQSIGYDMGYYISYIRSYNRGWSVGMLTC